MNRVRNARLFSFLIAAALAACNGANGSTSPATPTPSPSVQNISGDYLSGSTWQDSQSGTATAVSATLAQSGSSVGGVLSGTFTGATLTGSLALVLTTANTFTGTMVIDYPPAGTGPTCTFSTNGSYSNNGSTSATLNGSYSAVTNCSGDTGTFSLSQNCVDTVTSVIGERRRFSFPPQC